MPLRLNTRDDGFESAFTAFLSMKREVSQDVRQKKLLCLLAAEGTLDDIAEELGFSDRRSLWRSCNKWIGMSPSRFRKGQMPSLFAMKAA